MITDNINGHELGRLAIHNSIKQYLIDDTQALEQEEELINNLYYTLNEDEKEIFSRYVNLYRTVNNHAVVMYQEEQKALLCLNGFNSIIEDCRITEEFFDIVYNLPIEINTEIQTQLITRVARHGLINYFIEQHYSINDVKMVLKYRQSLYNAIYTLKAFNILLKALADYLDLEEINILNSDIDYMNEMINSYNDKVIELKNVISKYDADSVQGIFKDEKIDVLENLLFPIDKKLFTPKAGTYENMATAIIKVLKKGKSINIKELIKIPNKQLESESIIWNKTKTRAKI